MKNGDSAKKRPFYGTVFLKCRSIHQSVSFVVSFSSSVNLPFMGYAVFT